MTPDQLHGFVPAIITPFDPSGAIMYDAFAEIVEFLIARGATSLCVGGDNGESWALSASERGALTRRAKDAAKGRVHIITGCSATTLEASLAYARAAQENGADALLSMPQTYVLKATEAELLRRFEQLAAHTKLPIVLYNSPRRAGFSLRVGQIEKILDIAPVIGIKESHRDFFHHTHLLENLRERMSVMTGPCHYILPALALGAKGFIATGPEFIDLPPGELHAVAHGRGAWQSAHYQQAQHQLTVLYQLLMETATWPAAFKAALTLIGLPAGVPREPLLPATAADVDKIRATFDRLGIRY